MDYLLVRNARRIGGPFVRISLAGRFLLKDLGLIAAAVNAIAMAAVREPRRMKAQAVPA
jgi:hypothetical protein